MPKMPSKAKALLAASVVWSTFAGIKGAILDNPDSQLLKSYDFVVVGGGTAGNVVANRLTEDPNINVLVIEAGPTDAGVLEIEVPFLCTHTTPQTPWDWNYTTTPQPGLNGASITYPRGHVLGGTSSVNCLVYTRGSTSDYDRYASLTNDSGWGWSSMFNYFKKSEKFTPPSDGHNTTGQFNPSVHGFNGFNSVSLAGQSTSIDGKVVEAVQQVGKTKSDKTGVFNTNLDVNSGKPIGFGWSLSVIDGPSGSRSSSATGYLHPVLDRPNLHVIVDAQVSRILPKSPTPSTNGDVVAFDKVEYRLGKQAPLHQITASREIILSAGSINTPQILLNSGIGSSATLQSHSIRTLVDLPDVGENLSDHPIVTLSWTVNSTGSTLDGSSGTYDDFNRNATLQAEELAIWQKTRKGPFVNGIAQHIGFGKVPKDSDVFKAGKVEDPSSGDDAPHFEIFISDFLLGDTPSTGNFLSISAIMLTPGPSSRGSVRLATPSDPFTPPIIDAGLLVDNTTDVPLMREAVKSILRFVEGQGTSAWKGYVLGPQNVDQPRETSTDQEIESWIRTVARSAYHVVGTSSMSQSSEKNGVVDPDLRLKKTQGVRIIDASVLPFVPAGHSQAATYALAERGADLVKEAYLS